MIELYPTDWIGGKTKMAVSKYNPFFSTEVDEFPAGLRVFQDSLSRLLSEPGQRPWSPAVDIYETENEIVLKADIPDVTLTLKGERKFDSHNGGRGFHRIERSYGSFVRAFSLPETVEGEQVKADYKNGVLTIKLPKKELAKPRTINVEIANN
jgi:HSP20 family protein